MRLSGRPVPSPLPNHLRLGSPQWGPMRKLESNEIISRPIREMYIALHSFPIQQCSPRLRHSGQYPAFADPRLSERVLLRKFEISCHLCKPGSLLIVPVELPHIFRFAKVPERIMAESASRRMRKRRRIDYYVGDSDSEFDPSLPVRSPRPVRTSARLHQHSNSSDGEDDYIRREDSRGEYRLLQCIGEGLQRANSTTTKAARPFQKSRRKSQRIRQRSNKGLVSHFAQQKPQNQVALEGESPIPPNQKAQMSSSVPPWQILEHQILVQIVELAARMLGENDGRLSAASIRWLLKILRLSKALQAAAVSVIYHSPPIPSAAHAQGLLRLLSHPQHLLSTDYRIKIKRLDINVKSLMMKKRSISLPALVEKTPLLSDLRIYHPHDDIPETWAKASLSRQTWEYPGELFQTMESAHLRLRNFEWNGRFLSRSRPCIADRHRSECLDVRSLVFRNIHDVSESRFHQPQLMGAQQEVLDALGCLSQLEKLELRYCSIANDVFFTVIPPQILHTLTIHCCNELSSNGLQQYLMNYGHNLLRLDLTANRGLGLEFLAMLRITTPFLRFLRIELDLPPSQHRSTFTKYNLVVKPMWPRTLEYLFIANLQSNTREEIGELMSSLVDSSSCLSYLRCISIKFLYPDASWRERASLRIKWARALEEAFQPQPSLYSRATSFGQSGQANFRHSTRLTDQEFANSSHEQKSIIKQNGISGGRTGSPAHIFISIDNRPAQTQSNRVENFLHSESSDDDWRDSGV